MFWRPLSSLTHLLDFLVRPRSAFLAHAHSMLWFAALLAVLLALYRRLHVPWVAHLALLLYAVDDAHGMVLSFVANRNALVAATLAFAALLAHDRARRDAWRPGLWLAPALFGAALLGGEAALAVTAYLLAHALFVDQGPLARRLARLWPFATLAVAWLAAYKAMGYGTRGTGFYDDPSDGLVRVSRRPGRTPARAPGGTAWLPPVRCVVAATEAHSGRRLWRGAHDAGRRDFRPRPGPAPEARLPFLGRWRRALAPAHMRCIAG